MTRTYLSSTIFLVIQFPQTQLHVNIIPWTYKLSLTIYLIDRMESNLAYPVRQIEYVMSGIKRSLMLHLSLNIGIFYWEKGLLKRSILLSRFVLAYYLFHVIEAIYHYNGSFSFRAVNTFQASICLW